MEKFNFITKIIIKLDLNPNIVTLTGALGTIIGAVMLILDLRVASILFIAVFSLFDAMDGTIARVQNKQSSLGKFLFTSNPIQVGNDSAIFLAIMSQLNLEEISTLYILMAALAVSLITSYIQATAEIANVKILSGPLSRLPRVLLLLTAIITQQYRNILIIILILGIVTVVLRLYSGLIRISEKS